MFTAIGEPMLLVEEVTITLFSFRSLSLIKRGILSSPSFLGAFHRLLRFIVEYGGL